MKYAAIASYSRSGTRVTVTLTPEQVARLAALRSSLLQAEAQVTEDYTAEPKGTLPNIQPPIDD